MPQRYTLPQLLANSYATHLEEGKIIYPCTSLIATYQNSELIIYATLTLPIGTKSLVHLWQGGPLLGSIPQKHEQVYARLHSKKVLNLF